ncbi:MAG TPA: flagellar basal body-associated FliL family protein [Symbiobacteriaceae bacterium]|nr:flagellar basal body-associated FliL family protein [Symbiobacteriaceae bacterium]
MKTRILYIVGGLLALVAVVGISFLTAKLVGGSQGTYAAAGGAPAPHVKISEKNTVKLAEFVTNLADDRRYVKVTMELVLSSDKLKVDVDENVPRVRDTILQLLNAKKSMEVTGSEGANKLKADVKEAINKLLGGAPVHEVLITDIVVQ